MSKSLGNFFTVRELLAKYPGEVIRLVLLSTHYRQPLDFTDAALEQAKNILDSWYRTLLNLRHIPGCDAPPNEMEAAAQEVIYELLNDLNLSGAIQLLHEKASGLNKSEELNEKLLGFARDNFVYSAQAIGLLQQDPEAWFKWQPAGQDGMSDAEIEARIAARNSAKQVKNFAEADRIRQQLLEQNIILEDKPGGKTEWRRG